jgi:hypothetical protein
MITYSFDARKVGEWVCEKAGGIVTEACSAIGVERDGKLVAGIMYTGASIAMHSRCDDPAHVPRRFFFLIFDYPFNQLKVKRVTGIVSRANDKAIRVNTHLGWKYETTISDYFPDGDALVLIMRREDCRWLALGARYNPPIASERYAA